jgi:hypothetical protein
MKDYRAKAKLYEHVLVLIVPIIVFALMIMIACWAMPKLSLAADEIYTMTVSKDATQHTSRKTGNPYVRVIIEEERELKGHKYTTGVPVMFFEESMISDAMALKKGDTIKIIADYRSDYNSYTAKKILTE